MNIRVIDFGIITQHYKTYREGMNLIELEKEFYIESLNPFKEELQKLMLANNQSLIQDRRFREQKAERFDLLQKEALELEANFNEKVKKINDDVNSKVFKELEVIVREWAETNQIDLVTSKMEVIYNSSKIDSTEELLKILKDKQLFVEYPITKQS